MERFRKPDVSKIKVALREMYGADNLIIKNEVDELIYDITVREPLIFIEYHGVQHYLDLPSLRAPYDFLAIQEEDKRKREYCALHNIPLLIFNSGEKNFLTPSYIKYRISYLLGTYPWFGAKEFL